MFGILVTIVFILALRDGSSSHRCLGKRPNSAKLSECESPRHRTPSRVQFLGPRASVWGVSVGAFRTTYTGVARTRNSLSRGSIVDSP